MKGTKTFYSAVLRLETQGIQRQIGSAQTMVLGGQTSPIRFN